MIELPNHSYTLTELPPFVTVGKYSSIGINCRFHSLTEEHLCSVDHRVVFTYNWDQPKETGNIKIGNDVWIGEGVRILPNRNIGDGAIIGAGAVVAEDVPPYSVEIGNPARVSHFRFDGLIRKRLMEIRWWDWEYETVISRIDDMKDVTKFIEKYA